MNLETWIKIHKPYKNQLIKVATGYKVYAFESQGARYQQLFRLDDYDAIKGSTHHIVWLTPKK